MAKKQGKVKAIPVKEVTERMQVVWLSGIGYMWGTVLTKKGEGYIINFKNLSTQLRRNEVWISFSGLKTLVVEYDYDGKINENKIKFPSQLPLKYSQWQSAIDNGEVDSDKIVEFEEVPHTKRDERGHNQLITIAKIIPQKKRMYSEEELRNIVYGALTLATKPDFKLVQAEEIFQRLKNGLN